MGEAVWWVILGSLLYPQVSSESALTWGSSCPAECSCHLSYFADLPLNYWLQDNAGKKTSPSKENHNEVFYDDYEPSTTPGMPSKPNELLKMALCIFQNDVSPTKLLDQLPTDTQVLTLLQGRNTGEIILEPENMQHFHDLIYLDVQGYKHEELPDSEEDIHNNTLLLSHDLFKPLISLQYLNLQHTKLLSIGEKDNQIHSVNTPVAYVDPVSNEISMDLQNNFKKGPKDQPNMKDQQNLIFLTPSDSEREVVPYKTYLEKREQKEYSTFAGLSNLEFLRVYGCELHDISWEMFDGLSKLLFLSLEQNHLLFIPEFAFYGTPNLKTLFLSHNNLLNMQSTSLAGLLKLEKLDLSHNKFSHLSEFSLPPFPKLKTANFKHNPIEAIFSSTFEIMNATTTLYLGGNISALDIHPNSFLGLHSLQKLTIDNISIALLERQLLSGMPELNELEIFGIIKALSFDAFVEVPKLEKLILKNCQIESISMDAFYGLYALLVLDLSDNLLETLPPGLFDQQFSLKELYLQNNLLTELPLGFFKNLPSKMVRLEGNPWHCSCIMKDWPPSMINKVKQKKGSLCQREYDKGSTCSPSSDKIYIYNKKVTPYCATPKKYKGWSVFQVLRKELRCTKKLRNKLNRTFFLRKKYEDYEKLVKTGYYDQEREEYLEEIQRLSKSRYNISTSLKSQVIVNQHSDNMNKPLKNSTNLLVEPTSTHSSNVTPPSVEKLEATDDHAAVTQINRNTDIKNEGSSNSTQNDRITFQVPNQQTNELSPLSGTNDLLEDNLSISPNKINEESNNKATYYKTKLQKQKQITISTSQDRTAENNNVLQGQEDAKALKLKMKLEREKKHLKKLQKYYT